MGRPPDFPAWLAVRFPEEFRELFARAQQPPLPQDGRGEVADPGTFLTRAYFHSLALAVARNNYRQLAPWSQVAAQGWERDLVPTGSPRDTLVAFLERRALRLLGEALRRLGLRAGRDALLGWGEAWSGLSYRSPAVARLVREEEPVSPEAGGGRRLLANHGLAELNA